jgi:methylphosphotriester-DNA--protein-cysteine methyltransferase
VKKINTKIERDKHSLELICNWINEHLNERIGWTELTKISGLSHLEIHTLFHIFKRTSPMQWIRTQRERAKGMTHIGSGEDAIQMPNSLLAKSKKLKAE